MDWQKLISEIRVHGRLSQVEIGQRIGRSQAWVAAVVAGKYRDVGWSDGESIRKLHADLVPQSPSDAIPPEVLIGAE